MNEAGPWLALGLGLLILFILRAIASPLFWTLAVVATIVFGFSTAWRPEVLLLLATVLAATG